MSIFSKLFSGGISDVIDSVSGVVDKFTLSKEEKQEFKSEMQSRLMHIESELEKTYQKEIDARADIIKSEMAQGDKYTKRARPSIIYTGLAFIFIVHVIVPVVALINGNPIAEGNEITLPQEFWWAWGTVVSVYGAGRSAEKMGITNKITQLATGSGAHKVDSKKNIEG
ncbi:MAG: hypothetical protein GVY19_06800 [Bacteroidetes bacterium]|jgi:hypothetical protein|nr:hypothetical protein [Bacteroidota bacterium]